MKFSDTNLAYAAGIIDGEGCIGVYKQKNKKARVGYFIALIISVSMGDSEATLWLKDTFGGSHHCFKPLFRDNKPRFRWQMSATKASNFLCNLLPYLKVKKQQAELAIEFQALKNNQGYCGSTHHKPLGVLAKQEEIAKRIMLLKRCKEETIGS